MYYVRFPRSLRNVKDLPDDWGIDWQAVDHEGSVLESYVTLKRYKKAALKFL